MFKVLLKIDKPNGDRMEITYEALQRTEESVFSLPSLAKDELTKWTKGDLKIEIIDLSDD